MENIRNDHDDHGDEGFVFVDRRRRRSIFCKFVSAPTGIVAFPVLFFFFLIAVVVCCISPTENAFCHPPKIQQHRHQHHQYHHHHRHYHHYFDYCSLPSSPPSSSSSSTALCLFRPDWIRRAGRIEGKRKERRAMFESFRKRQEELGIIIQQPIIQSTKKNKDNKPQRYRVVSSNKKSSSNESKNGNIDISDSDSDKSTPVVDENTNTKNDDNGNDNDDDDLLKVYLFVPENDFDANDETNVFDRLRNGEIVTSVRRKKRVVKINDDDAKSNNNNKNQSSNNNNENVVIWIEHDRGGWSPSIVAGVTRLIPIEQHKDDNENDAFN